MKEFWTTWHPDIKDVHKHYSLEAIYDTMTGFKIVLAPTAIGTEQISDQNRKICLVFEAGTASYRVTDESYRVNTFHKLSKKEYENLDFGKWTFFIVTNSKYLQWILDESYGWGATFGFMHIVLMCVDDVIDIISSTYPEVLTAVCSCNDLCKCFTDK